jgi:hypothetical protein
MIDVWLGRPLPTEGVFSALPPATSVLNCPLARVGLTSCIISKTTPNSVSFQHPQWRRDVPLLTKVPMKAIQCLSPRALPPPSPCVSSPSPRSQILIFFLLGLVSPVRADSSISSATEVIKRISAGIRSPTENVTRSPGRRALARGERD